MWFPELRFEDTKHEWVNSSNSLPVHKPGGSEHFEQHWEEHYAKKRGFEGQRENRSNCNEIDSGIPKTRHAALIRSNTQPEKSYPLLRLGRLY
jgi:hypothetical protein